MLTQIPRGLDEILHTYGNPKLAGFEARNIVTVPVPYTLVYDGHSVNRVRCHRLAANNFVAGFQNIKDAGLQERFQEYNGLYAVRDIRGMKGFPSLHSWGVAIDMEAFNSKVGDRVTYPLGSHNRMPDEIVRCFTSVGFFYGGDFKARKDPMHFQLATGY